MSNTVDDVVMSNNDPTSSASSTDSAYEPSVESDFVDTDLEEETYGVLQPLRTNPVRAVRIPEGGEGSTSASERNPIM